MSGLSDLLCKIWRWFANLLTMVVNLVADLIRTLADVVVDLVDDLVDAVFGSSSFLWIAAAGLAVFLLLRNKDDNGPVYIKE